MLHFFYFSVLVEIHLFMQFSTQVSPPQQQSAANMQDNTVLLIQLIAYTTIGIYFLVKKTIQFIKKKPNKWLFWANLLIISGIFLSVAGVFWWASFLGAAFFGNFNYAYVTYSCISILAAIILFIKGSQLHRKGKVTESNQ